MCSNVYIYIHIKYQSSQGWLIWRSKQNKNRFVLGPPLLINHGQDACTSWLHALVDVTSPLPKESAREWWAFRKRLPQPCHGTSLVTELTAILSWSKPGRVYPSWLICMVIYHQNSRVHRDHDNSPRIWKTQYAAEPNFQANTRVLALISTHLSGMCFRFPPKKQSLWIITCWNPKILETTSP